MKRNFFHTEFATHAGFQSQLPRVFKYTIENRHALLPKMELERLAVSIRMILQSPLAQIFERILNTGCLNNFAALNIPNKGSSLPELLTTTNITLDIRQAETSNIGQALPEIRDRCLVNVSGTLKMNRQSGGFDVNATDLFQQLLVRGHLCMSYYDQENWLNAALTEFIVRSYSMILSNLISRYHDLSLMDQMLVAGVFALFYCQKMSPEKGNITDPPLFNRCTFVGNRNDLENIKAICKEVAPQGLTLSKVAEVISHHAPSRMDKFSVSEINILCGNLGPDAITSMIALEYPPYWLYELILAFSGTKIPLVYQLNNQKLMQEGRSKFLSQLLTHQALFDIRRG